MRKKRPVTFTSLTIRVSLLILFITVFIFLLAGRLNYWQGWVFIGLYTLIVVIMLFLVQKNPELMELIEERFHPGPGTKWWDKVFIVLYTIISFFYIAIGALDAGRFHWGPGIPVFIYILCGILYIAASLFSLWAIWTNKFFSSIVRIQKDRGHYVINSGPYGYVRHPGYSAGMIIFPALAALLGSVIAILPALILDILLIVRTYLEDTTLKNELDGYEEYAERVRYRLIPGVW
jgi:protein-S-isoprenylcysteine O-methyltransferase Ste14